MRTYQQGRRDRPGMTFRLRGWSAVAAVGIVVLFFGYRAVSARSALEGEQGELLRHHLQGTYTAGALPALRAAQEAGDTAGLSEGVDAVTSFDEIRFTDVGVKGTGDEVVVKLTIEVAGKAPPDGEPTRYFLLRHSAIGGWRVVREVGAMSYYLKLF